MMALLAFRNLWRNPRRTLAILLTVASGSAALMLFEGFNYGIMNQYKQNTIRSRYGHGQVNEKGYREKVYEKPWEHWINDADKVIGGLKALPEVEYVFPRIEFFALLTNGKINVSGRGQGIDGSQESKFFNMLNVEVGENLSTQSDGIILGKGLARALDVKPGDRVTVLLNTVHGSLNGGDFTVTGIFHTGSKDFDDTIFRIQIAEAQKLLDTNKVESVALGLRDERGWAKIEQWTKGEAALEATPFAVLDKVYYQHSVDWLNQQFAVFQFIILSIVILGIFNTVSSGILERRPEIGNLRANGETPLDIMKLLTIEGMTLGAFGAAAGILIAIALNLTVLRNGILMPPAPGLTRTFHALIEFQPGVGLRVFLLNGATAIIGTILAGIGVARKPIAELLRSN